MTRPTEHSGSADTGAQMTLGVVAAVSVVAALCLIIALGAPWYSWEIEAGRAVIGSGEVDAWHAWSGLDLVVVGLVSISAALTVIAAVAGRRSLWVFSLIPAAVALVGVVYMTLDQYSTPELSPLETETVTVAYGAWLGIGAAVLLVLAPVIGAWWVRSPTGRTSAALFAFGALALGLTVSGATAHDPTQRQVFYSNGAAPVDEKCAEGLARVAHGNHNRGFARSNTYALWTELVYPPGCKRLHERPNGTISTRFVYQVRKSGTWGGCDSSNLQKNANNTGLVEAYRNYGQHPCGSNHYYRTHGFFGYLSGAQNTWYNADFNSGDHFFG